MVDGETVKLFIKTNKDELDFSNAVDGNPTIITKNAETNIILLDGQTTVIGGLSKEKSSYGNRGIPWLKDIPVVGMAFSVSSYYPFIFQPNLLISLVAFCVG